MRPILPSRRRSPIRVAETKRIGADTKTVHRSAYTSRHDFISRGLTVIGRLHFLIPGIVLAMAGAWLPPWFGVLCLLGAQPLFAAAAPRLLDLPTETGFFETLLKRTPLTVLGLGCFVSMALVLVGWPLLEIMQTRSPQSVLWLSVGLLISIGFALRYWAIPGLLLILDEAYDHGTLRALGRADAFAAQRAGFQGDHHFGVRVALALAWIALSLGTAWASGLIPGFLVGHRLIVWAVLTIALMPALHAFTVWSTTLLWAQDETTDDAVPEHASTEADEASDSQDEAVSKTERTPVDRNLALLDAIAAGCIDQALNWVEQGADANVAPGPNDRDQRSALCMAATLSDLRLLRALIARGADPNRQANGMSALHAATRDSLHGRPDAVMTLLANGAKPDVRDHEGCTPLHHAALSEDPTIAAMLIDAGATLDTVNRESLTPLAVAARSGNETVVRLLLERGARPDVERAIPALIAACNGHDDQVAIVKRLLKAKPDIGARDRLGRTALHAAALHGHGDSADLLVAAGADTDARDSHGVTPLMEAARAGANRVLARLVFRKPDPTPTDAQGRNALHLACASKLANLDTVKILLALGIDRSSRAKDGRGAVEIAAAGGRWDLVAAIDPAAPRPQSLSDGLAEAPETQPDAVERERLILDALRHGRTHIAAELLAVEPALPNEALLRILRVVLERDQAEFLHKLLAHGLAPFTPPHDDSELMQLAARMQPAPLHCMQVLLASGGSAAGAGVLLPLLTNAAEGDAPATPVLDRFVQALIDSGADSQARIGNGSSALHLALRAGLSGTVRLLLARGVNPNATDHSGQTPLHLLLRLPGADHDTLIAALLAAGADPERRASDGETPVGRATLTRNDRALRLLRWTQWPLPRRALIASDLPAAAQSGDREAVKKLIEIGLPIDARDAKGCTALLRAAGGGFEQIVADLLALGADACLAAQTGATPLSAAISSGSERVVSVLVAHGVDVDHRLQGGATALMIACAIGNEAMVQMLLVRGASALAEDEAGNTPLHAVAQFAFGTENSTAATRMMDRLLDAGAKLDACNRDGQTPLLLLLGAAVSAGTRSPNRELCDLVLRLVHRGADLEVQDRRGVSVLHAAAMHGMREVAERLMQAGANPQLRDGLARTANEIAILLGYIDLATLLKRS